MLTRKQMEIEMTKANHAMKESKNTIEEATAGLKAMECLLEIANKEKEKLKLDYEEIWDLYGDWKSKAEELEQILVALAMHQIKQGQGDIEYDKVNGMEYFIPITKKELDLSEGLGVVITTEDDNTILTIGNKNYSLCDDCEEYEDCKDDIVEYNEFGRVAECDFFEISTGNRRSNECHTL